MDRVKALKKGSIYIEDKYPIELKPKQINSQQGAILSSQWQTSLAVRMKRSVAPPKN